jgi:GTP-binding protein
LKTYRAHFFFAAAESGKFPAAALPEIAVVGRSNSGKSTLINTLVGQHKLARVSNQPGRTRTINFFEIEERFVLVDLPGYGYAKGPHFEQAAWQTLVDSYLKAERDLRGVIALFDVRREPDALDSALLALLAGRAVAFQAVWTKLDKLRNSERPGRTGKLDRALNLPARGIGFSSMDRTGREELWTWIEERIG